NKPEIVFLDEMTTGLDPATRRTTWEYITSLRDQGTTVVLVTHFMDEAERLCDRVAILQRGRILAMDTPARLMVTSHQGVKVSFTWDGEAAPALAGIPHVRQIQQSNTQFVIEGEGPVFQHVAATLLQQGIEPADLRVEQPSLEEIFLQLVGK